MGNFLGGSAYGMANQITDGYIIVSPRTFQRLQRAELDKLSFEMDKRLREVRADQPDIDDLKAVQGKNRKMMRLTGALRMLKSYRMSRKI